MRLEAGKFDRKVVFQSITETPDSGSGEIAPTWSTYKTTWAQYLPMKENERFAAGRELGTFVADFIVRYFSALSEKDRIQFDGRNWDILGFAEIGRRRAWRIRAEVKR